MYSGKGTYKHASGAVFEGDYFRGERNGHGVLTAADGKVLYNGMWKDGKKVSSSEGPG